jgi:2-polyprenyl-3-methyl-5-hydroxy-6-metoxy-1,4-benzoquinol methylase
MMRSSLLAERRLVPEDMDDPSLATEQLHGALLGLARLNRISHSARILWKPISHVARALSPKPVRVLDIATGSGDIPIALWQRAQRQGLKLEITGIDVSPRTIEFARQRAERLQSPIQFQCYNALENDLTAEYEVVMCSLFLHHLPRDHAVELLRRMAAAARRAVLISDLRRSAYGLALAFAASRIFSRSQVVHDDAVRSVRAAFTRSELADIAKQAGLGQFQIARKWPARMLLTWQRPKAVAVV